jgi:hypothetical protein
MVEFRTSSTHACHVVLGEAAGLRWTPLTWQVGSGWVARWCWAMSFGENQNPFLHRVRQKILVFVDRGVVCC